jgi:hypothetical protein
MAQLGTALGVAALLLTASTVDRLGLVVSGAQLASALAAVVASATALVVVLHGRSTAPPASRHPTTTAAR